ncbi:hypothetical protein, partial [Neoroseomonas alkaliterrae]|uniref:hypothetical protein n=1 Tax=Neoroseomonas alkaliterrae TaxID=1452450 RepID=UPI001BAC0EC4
MAFLQWFRRSAQSDGRLAILQTAADSDAARAPPPPARIGACRHPRRGIRYAARAESGIAAMPLRLARRRALLAAAAAPLALPGCA